MVFRVPEAQIRERMVIGKHLADIVRFIASVGHFLGPTLIFSHEHATLTLAYIFPATFLQTLLQTAQYITIYLSPNQLAFTIPHFGKKVLVLPSRLAIIRASLTCDQPSCIICHLPSSDLQPSVFLQLNGDVRASSTFSHF